MDQLKYNFGKLCILTIYNDKAWLGLVRSLNNFY